MWTVLFAGPQKTILRERRRRPSKEAHLLLPLRLVALGRDSRPFFPRSTSNRVRVRTVAHAAPDAKRKSKWQSEP
jgi:hypothetical protein